MNINELRASLRGQRYQTPSGQLPVDKATLISAPDRQSLQNANWLQGTVAELGRDGLFRVTTAVGDVTLSARGASLAEGDEIMLSLDRTSGKILFSTFTPSANPVEANPTEVRPAAVEPTQSAVQATLAASGVTPVTHATSGHSAASQQALSAIVPYAHSTSFALAAALLPMTIRGGLLAELIDNQERRYGALSRLTNVATTINIEQVKPIDGSYGYISWNMPFFSEGQILSARWKYGEETSIEDETKRIRRTSFEATFPFSGKLVIEILLDENNAAVAIASDLEMEEELVAELREIIHLISASMGLLSSVSYAWGPGATDPDTDES